MGNELVVQETQLPQGQRALRAAQYVRMSTDYQRYSIENQAAAIAAYAQGHNLSIVRTYRDQGESGLTIKHRTGLIELIHDVRSGCADYGHILVYDVSRWGRFQDIDESAHYEFLCKQMGIKVIYCAEEFDNNGSLISSIVKNLKRVMAAEHSRELSAKVHAGQCRLAALGFKQGGSASYALRRDLVDENSQSRGFLDRGERKYLNTDRVRLRLGSENEVEIVKWIFEQFLKTRCESKIARQLNQKGIPNKQGEAWNRRLVHLVLINENYIGNIVFNRLSCRLGQKATNNPEHMWVRGVGAIEPIVEPTVFQRVNRILKERRICVSKEEMLSRLRAVLQRRGRLTAAIINETPGLPSAATYMAHFGTLRKAYRMIGYSSKRDCDWIDSQHRWSEVIAVLAAKAATALQNAGLRTDPYTARDCLLVGRTQGISFRIARVSPGKQERHSTRWSFHRRKYAPPGIVVAVRLAKGREAVFDYVMVPTSELDNETIRFTERSRHCYRWPQYPSEDKLIRAIVRRFTKVEGAALTRRSPLTELQLKGRPKKGNVRSRH